MNISNRRHSIKLLSAALWLLLLSMLPAGSRSQGTPVTPPAPYTGTTVNYTREWLATAPEQSTTNLVLRPLTDVKQVTQYFDGLGRPMQTVAMQASPLGNDMVSPSCYDPATGNEIYKYLPYTSNAATTGDLTSDGAFKPDCFQQQVAFYNTYLSGQQGEANAAGNLNWAYSQTNYDASPLKRVLSSYAPGVNWVGSAGGATPHLAQQALWVNTATDNVQEWNIAAAQGSIPTSGGAYPAGSLYKSVSTDEQGHQVVEFKDQFGQVVLKKEQNGAVSDNGGGSGDAGWLCTYTVYDDYGNLRFIIPPAVVQQVEGAWSISQTLADELCYRFEYDLLDRMIIRRTPGTGSGSQGEVWMVYDARGRLVLQQDGNMRPSSQWLCILYDAVDRQVVTATITYSSTLAALQQLVTTQTTNVSLFPHSPLIVSGPGYSVTVNSTPLPPGVTPVPMILKFYDNYNWVPASGSGLSATLDQTNTGNANYFLTTYNTVPTYAVQPVQSSQTQGLATGQMVQVLGSTGPFLFSFPIYDEHGRVIQAQQTNIGAGKDVTTMEYSWDGRVLRKLVSHSVTNANPQSHLVSTAMSYDAMGRLLTITKAVNSTIGTVTVNAAPVTIVTNQYNELSQLKQQALGASIETLSYDYNVRGWPLGVNRAFAKSTATGTNYFGYDLGYDQGAISTGGAQIGSYAAPDFNGSIAGVVWKSRGDNQIRKYDYTYDGVHRLGAADFNQFSGSTFNKTAGLDFSVGGMSYDGNGNIGSMNQNGWIPGGSQQIDQLSYTHMNGGSSNRLMNVMDNSAYNANGTPSTLGDLHYAGTKVAATSTDYGYDPNGNVTSDFNRSISTIAYNYLNLPQLITISNGKGSVQYVYDAAGNKLQKITNETNGSVRLNGVSYTTGIKTTTTYIGDFVYKSVSYTLPALNAFQYTNDLQFIGHEQGRVRALYTNAATPYTPASYAVDYFIRDHLKNVRMVLTNELQADIYPAATLETATFNGGTAESLESQYYTINTADIVATSSLSWFTAATGSTYQNQNNGGTPVNNDPYSSTTSNSAQVYRLNGQTGDKTGLGITLKVMAGDQVSIFGKSVWHNTGTAPGSFPITSALSTFINAFAGTTGSLGEQAVSGTALNGASATTVPLANYLNGTQAQSNPTVAPKAAINWILFNDQFVPVSMGTDLVSSTGDVVKTHSDLNIPMAANGYLYVYCSNESDIDVFFDNLQVTNTRGPILEENHYYPYGLTMAGISDRAWNKLQNFTHLQSNEMQNQEFSDGTGLEEYDFHARFYDQQLGIWHNQDPVTHAASPYSAMENNPLTYTDADGKCPICIVLIVAAVVGGGLDAWANKDNIHNFWEGLGYFAAGAIAADAVVLSDGSAADLATIPSGWFGSALVSFGSFASASGFATGTGAAVSGAFSPVAFAVGGLAQDIADGADVGFKNLTGWQYLGDFFTGGLNGLSSESDATIGTGFLNATKSVAFNSAFAPNVVADKSTLMGNVWASLVGNFSVEDVSAGVFKSLLKTFAGDLRKQTWNNFGGYVESAIGGGALAWGGDGAKAIVKIPDFGTKVLDYFFDSIEQISATPKR